MELMRETKKDRSTGGKIDTDGTLIRSEEGPKGLAATPTAHMAQVIFSLPVAVNTLGGYYWRHRGDF